VQSGLTSFLSTDLRYPFLNFRVRIGQQGIRIKGIKLNPFLAVLCWIAGILVNKRLDKQSLTVFESLSIL